MAKTSKIVKNNKKRKKYEIRVRNRCMVCGRPRAFIRYFGICRLCFRKFAQEGQLPGVTKASW